MSLMYDKKVFSERLRNLRDSRWKQYKENQDKQVNPYERFACCQSQEAISEELQVERRTYGKWENGTTIPTIDKVADICNILDCNIDYLLGANELIGISPSVIASHYSGISVDIIELSNTDSNYRDFLNYFMHPDNCSTLINSCTKTAWKDFLSKQELTELREPLKSLILDIFTNYQSITPFCRYDIESYKEYVLSCFPESKLSFSHKKLNDSICIDTCLSANIKNKFGITTDNPNCYINFINYISDYSFEILSNAEMLAIQKQHLGQSFVRLYEKYLDEDK